MIDENVSALAPLFMTSLSLDRNSNFQSGMALNEAQQRALVRGIILSSVSDDILIQKEPFVSWLKPAVWQVSATQSEELDEKNEKDEKDEKQDIHSREELFTLYLVELRFRIHEIIKVFLQRELGSETVFSAFQTWNDKLKTLDYSNVPRALTEWGAICDEIRNFSFKKKEDRQNSQQPFLHSIALINLSEGIKQLCILPQALGFELILPTRHITTQSPDNHFMKAFAEELEAFLTAAKVARAGIYQIDIPLTQRERIKKDLKKMAQYALLSIPGIGFIGKVLVHGSSAVEGVFSGMAQLTMTRDVVSVANGLSQTPGVEKMIRQIERAPENCRKYMAKEISRYR